MTKKLFLEPHYGDIAWSCGGLLYLNKEDSIILNIFPPRKKYDFLNLKRRRNYRRAKKREKAFVELFGVKIIYWKYKSAFLRGRTDKNFFDRNLTELEENMVVEIRQEIEKLILEEKITEVYCPYAQRNQVDHIIVRKAVKGFTITNAKIFYYEDFPNFHPQSEKIKDPSMIPSRVDISASIEEKIKAILIYEHLVKAFFKDTETLIDLVWKKPFETYWYEK